jgi:hypothetical protein
MKRENTPPRHQLLIYRRLMDRIWPATILLTFLLGFVWWRASAGKVPWLQPPWDAGVFVGAILLLLITLYTFMARKLGYVQVFPTYIRVATPILRLNISYRRLKRAYPAEFRKLYPPAEASWSQRRFLKPFYPKTVVVAELNSYPLTPELMQVFFPPQMFLPQGKGLVFLVPDWMQLSNELDSHWQTWQQARRTRHG